MPACSDSHGVNTTPPADLEAIHAAVPMAARAAAEESESLADVVDRVRPWVRTVLRPRVHLQRRVLVVAHGNSLRALVMVLDDLEESEIEDLNIATAEPLRYTVNAAGEVVARSGVYLDPESARAATVRVAQEGGT